MHKLTIFILSIHLIILAVSAQATVSPPATYILQITSNLGCDTHDIVVVSEKDNSERILQFSNNAFAAIEVPAGKYSFGDVTCTKDNASETFDMLKGTIATIELVSGQAYFGGRIIFEEIEANKVSDAPKELLDCTRSISRVRNEQDDNECRDGQGIIASNKASKKINVYAPEVTAEELAIVRNAMAATEEQLLYLPLQV